MKIEVTPLSQLKARAKNYFDRHTRAPQGSEEYWQQKLTELDEKLYLRWSHLTKQYLVYYEYRGLLDVIRTFRPGGFYEAFENIRHNGSLTARHLRQIAAAQREKEEQAIENKIDECCDEVRSTYDKVLRRKVVTDGVKDNRY